MKPLLLLSLLLCTTMFLAAQDTNGYCLNKGPRSNVWLQKVSIGSWTNNSGANGGYLNTPDSKLTVRTDTTYAVQLDLGGYPRVQDTAYWRIWIDFNGDKDFEDVGEQVLQTKSLYKSSTKTTLALKSALVNASGKFLMRVILSRTAFSSPCGGNNTIEIEDYGIEVRTQQICAAPSTEQFSVQKVGINQATVFFSGFLKQAYQLELRSANSPNASTFVLINEDSLSFISLTPKHTYELRLGIKCESGEIKWSEVKTFTTLAPPPAACTAIPKDKISFTQIDIGYVRIKIDENYPLEKVTWRYRKVGDGNNWLYTGGPTDREINILGMVVGENYEVQVRKRCGNSEELSDWSESLLVYTLECVLPVENKVSINMQFYNFPDLHVSFNVFNQRDYDYSYRFFYRKQGSTTWIDTISTTTRTTEIVNLSPDSTYEVRIEVYCGKEFKTFFRTITAPSECFLIERKDLRVENITNTTAHVYALSVNSRTCQYRYRVKGGTAYTFRGVAGFNGSLELENLQPNTTYEISARIICGDPGQQADWSDTLEFTTKGCLIPQDGDLAIVKYYGADSVLLSATYFTNDFDRGLDYFWQYKQENDAQWATQHQRGNQLFLLKGLQRDAKYQLRVTVKCPNSSEDSLLLTRTLVASTTCNLAPDTSFLNIEQTPTQWDITATIPRGYSYQIRYRYAGDAVFTQQSRELPYNYLIGFGFPQVTYEIQFRVICPNGNTSPWSETISTKTRRPFAPDGVAQLALLPKAETKQLQISPNPSTGRFQVDFPIEDESAQQSVIEVFNLAGQKVLSQKIDGYGTFLDLSNQASGLYFVRMLAGNQNFTVSNTIWEEYAEEKNPVQIVSTEDLIHLDAYSRLDTCETPNILNIKVNQDRWYNAQLSYQGIDNKALQWRYRKKGADNWKYPYITTNPITNIEFEAGGGEYEIQVRQNCPNLGVWSEWSESLFVEFAACVFPNAKDIRFDTSFSAFPSLRISILLLQRADPFSFKWYYRELGQTTWVDTIRSTNFAISIQNLSPGKVYEVRVDVRCGNDFVSYFKRIEVPPSCLIISKINIREVHDSSVFVELRLGQIRMIEYRYRIVGQPNYSFIKLRTGSYLKGLIPGTTYEISARVVCEDTLLIWSPSLIFTTKNCKLPLAGDISLLQFKTQDAATFSADYLNFNFPVQHNYTWRYKPADQNLWTTPTNGKQQQFTLSNLSGGQKYDLSVAIACPNHPQDSLRLETSFTAQLDSCTEQPDTASVQITFQQNTLDPVIEFKSPKGYRYQMRTKPENGYFVQYFSDAFEDIYLTSFSLYPGMNDFQFRLICPNGNKSPWSAVIKLFNRKNPGTIKAPKIQSGLVERLTDAPPSGTIRVIPNPSPGKIDIVFPELTTPLTGARLEVFNTSGQRVLTLKTSIEPTQNLPLDLSSQTPGLYFLRIQAGQKVYTERIMIASNR